MAALQRAVFYQGFAQLLHKERPSARWAIRATTSAGTVSLCNTCAIIVGNWLSDKPCNEMRVSYVYSPNGGV
jgi:hypothetical protein